MGDFVTIRPEEDAESQHVGVWCGDLITNLKGKGHSHVRDVDGSSPADKKNILAALGLTFGVAFYFGHGTETEWQTGGSKTVDASTIHPASKKCIVSVACKTGVQFGPDAITAGVKSWMGLTVKLGYVAAPGLDPFGDAAVRALSILDPGVSMQDLLNKWIDEFDQLVTACDTGGLHASALGQLAYFVAVAVRDHVVLHGTVAACPF